jgi:hypothetical protein
LEGDGFGERLRSSTLDAHLRKSREDLAAFRVSNPAMALESKQLTADARRKLFTARRGH